MEPHDPEQPALERRVEQLQEQYEAQWLGTFDQLGIASTFEEFMDVLKR